EPPADQRHDDSSALWTVLQRRPAAGLDAQRSQVLGRGRMAGVVGRWFLDGSRRLGRGRVGWSQRQDREKSEPEQTNDADAHDRAPPGWGHILTRTIVRSLTAATSHLAVAPVHLLFSQWFSRRSVSGSSTNFTVALHRCVNVFGSSNVN